jgi:hypothetical protein
MISIQNVVKPYYDFTLKNLALYRADRQFGPPRSTSSLADHMAYGAYRVPACHMAMVVTSAVVDTALVVPRLVVGCEQGSWPRPAFFPDQEAQNGLWFYANVAAFVVGRGISYGLGAACGLAVFLFYGAYVGKPYADVIGAGHYVGTLIGDVLTKPFFDFSELARVLCVDALTLGGATIGTAAGSIGCSLGHLVDLCTYPLGRLAAGAGPQVPSVDSLAPSV